MVRVKSARDYSSYEIEYITDLATSIQVIQISINAYQKEFAIFIIHFSEIHSLVIISYKTGFVEV